MSDPGQDRTIEKLLRQQASLASFGTFAFRETDLGKILTEAARVCALSLNVPYSKVCRYRAAERDLLIVAGCGWKLGVVGHVVSQADESSPQGRAYITGKPVIIRNIGQANDLRLPAFYPEHGIVSTVDVVIPGVDGPPFGVLEIDSPRQHQYDEHDINFLTGFANVLAEAVATANRVRALKALVDAKELLAEELQHRVRNNLQIITSMLAGIARASNDADARESIDGVVRRVTILAQIYDSLLGVGLSETVDLGAYLEALCANLPGLQPERPRPVRLSCVVEPMLMDLDGVTKIGLVVAELVSNSYSHAFPGREGRIAVSLSRARNAGAGTGGGAATRIDTRGQVRITDDGVGFLVKRDSLRHGLGLAIRLMEQVGGALDVHSGDGTQWTLSFPLPGAAAARAA